MNELKKIVLICAIAALEGSFAFQLAYERKQPSLPFSNNIHSKQCSSIKKSTRSRTCLNQLSNGEISRYSRHLVLGDVGMKGQSALKDASVLVIGAGGLGSPCLMYLAAAGIGHIGIVVSQSILHMNNLRCFTKNIV